MSIITDIQILKSYIGMSKAVTPEDGKDLVQGIHDACDRVIEYAEKCANLDKMSHGDVLQ